MLKSVIAGTVDCAARARTHDATDLRHDSAGQRVAQKNVGVTAQADHAFLNPRAAGIVESDNRRANLHRQIHHLANFFGVRFGKGTAEDGEVLGEYKNLSTINQAVPGDHAIAGIRSAGPYRNRASDVRPAYRIPESCLHRAGSRLVRARSSCRQRAASRRGAAPPPASACCSRSRS